MTAKNGNVGKRRLAGIRWPVLQLAAFAGGPAVAAGIAAYAVEGDAIMMPLEGRTGDAARGREIVLDRQVGNCLICHAVPNEPKELFQGDIAPSLAGVGSRLAAGQIRLRIVDQRRVNPASVMPPFHRVDGLNRVAMRYIGKPALDAQQIEDIVAYLAGLRE